MVAPRWRRHQRAASNVTFALRLHDISKRLGNRWVLARLSLQVPAGSSVLLTGDNGAGKTTLLKVVSTLLKPTYGHVELFGQSARANLAELRRRIGLMTHASHLYDSQSGRENLRFMARMEGDGALARLEDVLTRVGLSQHADRPVRGYSAGMKRRLMMARLWLKSPELVLLDEPWGQLDAGAISLMDDLIREMHQRGATLVIATHDVDHGRALCDHKLRLAHGRQVGALEPLRRPS